MKAADAAPMPPGPGGCRSRLRLYFFWPCVPGGRLSRGRDWHCSENDGGGGTKCKHWDEDSFAVAGSSELMTGGFEAGLYQPISRMTVAALDDLGVYGPLNYDAADPYPATRRKLEEGPGFEVLTPTESFTLDGDDEYVVEVEPVPLDA